MRTIQALEPDILQTLGIAIAVIVDLVLLTTFNRFYFRVGIPLYWNRVTVVSAAHDIPDAAALESDLGRSAAIALLFRGLGLRHIGFREALIGGGFFKLHYPPLMHGLLSFDHERHTVTVIGYANVSICSLFAALLLDAPWSLDAGSSVILLGVFAACYVIQVVRFSSVARLAAEKWQRCR